MSKEESREERKKTQNKTGLSKVYYWVIGILFLILLLLVVYIFANSGDKIDLGSEEASTQVQEEEAANKEETKTEPTPEEETASEEEVAEKEESEEIEEEPEKEEDETVVNEDAPLDTGHAVDYNSGSADRIAIKNKVMEVTGLENDLIESWVGNDGPGRVTADVYSPDKSKIYRVYLQYGEGEWHVTNYESLSSVPNN